MCGIAGIININKSQTPIRRDLLNRMVSILTHRGPDEDGYYIDEYIGMGMRRLKIIDLETGHQPITNEDNSVVSVFNGEIYNYKCLTKELQANGHIFKTRSDAEVIVHAYEEWGINFLDKLNGMFAIALWDNRHKKFYLIRDRLGIKPIYYCKTKNKLYFASEIKSIMIAPEFKKDIDTDALDLFFNLRYIPAPLTIFKSTKKLPPASILKFANGKIHINYYWNLKKLIYQTPSHSKSDIIDEFSELLTSSIKLRLKSDVPLGIFLSGGLDSSSIVAIVSKFQKNISTFSMGFETGSNKNQFNELPFAHLVAKKFCTNHHECVLHPSLADILPKLIWHLDEPFADPAILPTYYLSEMTRKQVTVALSGEGSDELFGGYEKYKYEKMLSLINKYIPMSKQFIKYLSQKTNSINLLGMTDVERWMNWDRVFSPSDLKRLYNRAFHIPNSNLLSEKMSSVFNLQYSYFNNLNAIDFQYWLPDDLLMKVDKISMSSSLEVRVPFLDHRLVEFMFKLKNNNKIKGFNQKYLLRKFMNKTLPAKIIRRKKHGFSLPVDEWLRTDLKNFTNEILLNSSILKNGIIDKIYVEDLLRNHFSGEKNLGRKIWSLLNFEIWYRRFIENETL